jgi:dihydroorotate dehydrogenase
MRLVNATPFGPILIDLLGHMKPEAWTHRSLGGVPFPSQVGVAAEIDPEGLAAGALSRFGIGLIVVGPVASSIETAALAGRLLGRNASRVPLAVRVAASAVSGPLDQAKNTARELLAPLSDQKLAFLIADETPGDDQTDELLSGVKVLRAATADWTRPPKLIARIGAIGEGVATDAALAGFTTFDAEGVMVVLVDDHVGRSVRQLRSVLNDDLLLIAEAGCASPRDALRVFDAGADLLLLNRGLIEAGPGLPKRINQALAEPSVGSVVPPRRATGSGRWQWPGWVWSEVLGIGMIAAGLITLIIGLTFAILPYDQSFVGLDREGIKIINPRLIPFLRHDRITLAGTMMAIGVIYAFLAARGMRERWDWSRRALLCSGAIGFASLFLFLGFHYVDPAHVILSGSLFPLFLLGVGRPVASLPHKSLDLVNDHAWRRGLWGQLLFVGLGVGLVGAGVIISFVGVTTVFVQSDLAFLHTTAGALASANAHLLPLIAHDRAGFGGALASDGVAVALVALWGFRRGARWIWWMFLLSGGIGLSCGLMAHLSVGYLELGHLLPLLVSGVVFVVALSLSHPYLCDRTRPGTNTGASTT